MHQPTYSDEYIQHYGVIFTSNNLFARGITFEDFLKDPESYITAFIYNDPNKLMLIYMPGSLLPKQRRLQKELDQQELAEVVELQLVRDLEDEPEIHCVNGRYFEPMRHTAWPANHGRGNHRRLHR